MNNFYVYLHRRLDTGEVFYVGKGRNKRAFDKSKRNNQWYNIINSVGYSIEIIKNNLDEVGAFLWEGYYIKTLNTYHYWNEKGCNYTFGGEGSSGRKLSNETKDKISKSNLGKILSQEHRKNISKATSGINNPMFGKISYMKGKFKELNPWYGKKHTQESIEKIRSSSKGRIFSKETRNKISEANRKRIVTEETRLKMSKFRKGNKELHIVPRDISVINNFGNIFSSAKKAAEWCNCCNGSPITQCCKGNVKSAGKHPITGEKLIWKYYIREGGI